MPSTSRITNVGGENIREGKRNKIEISEKFIYITDDTSCDEFDGKLKKELTLVF